MNVYPFYEIAAAIDEKIKHGFDIYQQFNCAKCGTKQTMPDANVLYKLGICEECGHTTNIEHDGCNYMAAKGVNISDLIKAVREKDH